MQNAKRKMQNAKPFKNAKWPFCILHFAKFLQNEKKICKMTIFLQNRAKLLKILYDSTVFSYEQQLFY